MIRHTSRSKRSLSDDLSYLKDSKSYTIILEIQHLISKLWDLLKDINTILYQQDTNEIIKNKPVFDKQKRLLICLDSQINNLYQQGLVIQIKPLKLLNSEELNINTEFKDWNKIAKQVNIKFKILEQSMNKEKDIVLLINSDQEKIIKKSGFNKFIAYMLIILVLMTFGLMSKSML